ncbi:MAG TPA: dihydrolipoamide acetyltransferase family protein [Gemmatimonadaceae bacterium]|jgi:pyruvate dehydrogenase E2 component (dihydrolipoamide acetyltransferase)|nr:dihydrolipoamide acetyltransferase family protein [Gemmatimonadaceae bacterium]
MSRVDVVMPQMGESIAEGTLSKWLKKVGDEIKRDEPIFEISTDKVDAEIPAPTSGVLAEIIITEGQTVPVQTIVARIETEKGAAISASPAPQKTPEAGGPAPGVVPPSTEALRSRSLSGGGNGTGSIAAERAPESQPQHVAVANSFEDRLRTKSSPLVRKMAAEHGVDIAALQGSGIAGRVTKKDFIAFIDSGAQVPTARPSMHAPAGVSVTHGPVPEPWPGDRVEPMSKMRALISEHMVISRHTSAHVTSFMELDFTRVARIRAANRKDFEAATGEKLSYMPFIIKATVDAIRQFPILNSSVAGTNVIYRKQVNMGIAVALDWGLIVPVIKNADDLSLTGLTRSLNDLANRARVKKLSPEEVQGGTFTITNPGVFGSLMGTPIINQPQVAILGVGAIEKRPKVVRGVDGEDTIAIRTCAYFSLSFDHRVIDGATADEFLATVKRNIETFPEAGVL